MTQQIFQAVFFGGESHIPTPNSQRWMDRTIQQIWTVRMHILHTQISDTDIVVFETRGSAIAERPRCRVRFRQK